MRAPPPDVSSSSYERTFVTDNSISTRMRRPRYSPRPSDSTVPESRNVPPTSLADANGNVASSTSAISRSTMVGYGSTISVRRVFGTSVHRDSDIGERLAESGVEVSPFEHRGRIGA